MNSKATRLQYGVGHELRVRALRWVAACALSFLCRAKFEYRSQASCVHALSLKDRVEEIVDVDVPALAGCARSPASLA